MPYCPLCGDSLPGEQARCPRCVPRERRAAVAPKSRKTRAPAARFTATLRGVEVLVTGSSFLLVGYLLGTAAGFVPPVDVTRLLGTPAIASEFLVDPVWADPPPPFVMELADQEVIDLRSGDHYETSFEVRDPRPCTLTGRVRGLEGGKRDVEVYVLDEDGYLDWQSGIPPRTVYESGRSPSARIDVDLPGRGRYHLLLSNSFSFLTAKRVRLDDARLRCA